jgi:hypothetical protein
MTTVAAGTTQSSPINMSGNDQLLVEAGGKGSVPADGPIRFNAPANGAVITDHGIIESKSRPIRPEAVQDDVLPHEPDSSRWIRASCLDDARMVRTADWVAKGIAADAVPFDIGESR